MQEAAKEEDRVPTEAGSAEAEWPYSSLLLFGFFGTDTPAGKRLARRTTAGLVLFLISGLALSGEGTLVPHWVWVLAVPLSVAGIAGAFAVYLRQLDELSRLIQLKAFAFSYGALMTLALGLSAVVMVRPALAHPAMLLSGLVVVEALRGLALVVLARRYR